MFRYARVVLEQRWLVLFVFLVGVALFATWAKQTPRVYKATGTILVEAMPPQVMGDQVRDVMTGPGQFLAMDDYLRTQRSVLLSDGIARQGIQVMHLASDTDFWVDGMPVDPNDAVERFVASLTVEVVPRTQIFSLSYRHRDPKQAKRAVDGIIDVYIENNLKLRERSNADASRWLAEQADSLRQRLSKSENELYQFKADHDLLSVSLEDRANNVTQQIDKLSTGLSDARLRKAALVSGRDELRKMRAADPFSVAPAGVPMSLLDRKARYNEENEKLVELEGRYEPAHPLVRRQKSKVAVARAAVLKETDLVVLGAEARANEVVAEERKIAGELAALKQDGMRVNRLEIDYNRLKRDTGLLSKQYELVAQRMKETELAAQSKGNNLHVLDYARTPRIPVTPNLMRDAPLALLASLVVAVAVAFAAHAADRRVRGQEDIEGRTGLRVLASIPFVRGRGDHPIAYDPYSTTAELYRLIRTNLLFADANRRLRRVLVTSAVPQDGRTFTAINLATVMAQCEDKKVLLIDCDLRATRVASALGMGEHAGLTDVVLGAATLDEAIQSTHIPNLRVLCAGPMPPSPAELLGGRRFQEILDACSERFDWVIIDSPPAGLVSDPVILAKACDGAIVVVRSKHTTYNQLARAERALADGSPTVVGVVLSGTEQSDAGYGYGKRKRPNSHAAVRARGPA
ncbi:MAG: polysaccharide biosynthesis tyrosine autokinase [Myxococcales bacterium]|nr:polysaccharide biosynthesis tyrosine autokinase [Myxococcales bacterium]